MKKILFGLVAVAMVACGQLMAQDSEETKSACEKLKPSISLNFNISNRYMSDGEIVNPETMMFGDLTLAWDCGLYFDVWMAHDLNDFNEGDKIDHDPEEIDYTVGYSYEFKDLDGIKSLALDLSYAYWDMPKRSGWNCKGATQQKVTLKATTGLFLNPGLKVAWDFENDEVQIDTFIEYGDKCGDLLDGRLKYKVGLDVFWFNAAWRANRYVKRYKDTENYWKYNSGFATAVLSGSLKYEINDNFYCGPFVKLSTCLDKTTRKMWKDSANHKSKINNLVGFEIGADF